ncbi:hypothetical protein [Maritimibacter sp. DP1N21-5]|uniref:hypothetical protein n=1 Tax=Maritimibacter sp. DP1N21-5 TaxID=2836867 RepID=UPI001C44BC7C|nr:hypothetical protein [Maritimibacter sp. DP1N21-5]MBV7408710.1 hypothetical protein [Maritimibacter sp. DP1N21-5]
MSQWHRIDDPFFEFAMKLQLEEDRLRKARRTAEVRARTAAKPDKRAKVKAARKQRRRTR